MGWKGKETVEESTNRIAKLDKERRTIERREGEVVPQPEDLSLGEVREFKLAVLHIDIDNFKQTIGNLSMTEMMRFASIFLTEMTYIIKEFDGAVEQYVGDSVTALFGVDYEAPKAAENCLNCALAMLTLIKYSVNQYLTNQELPTFTCSIGIDLDETWIERVGIRGTNQLTLIGHGVSRAAQLRELANPNEILLGDKLFQNLSDDEKKYCIAQPAASDWDWTYTNSQRAYPYYRYTGFWKQYPLS